jgi:hypothetical protein
MQIHVARNGQQLGQYSVEEVNGKLADGTFSPTDLAWHEGAAGWAPLTSITGVTLPGTPASPPMPAPPATPSPAPVRLAAATSSSAGVMSPQPTRSNKGMIASCWILLGFTFVISLVPVLGCGSWILVWPVALATLIMAIVILTRGGQVQGTLLIIASVLIVPWALLAPVITIAALGGAVSKEEHKQETQIMENLRAISEAKARWVAQTKVTDGARTTVAGLAPYLDGKEIKPIVGETYDPRPVGQEPTATLPETKSLASHGKGAVLTAGDSITTEESPSPATTPEIL